MNARPPFRPAWSPLAAGLLCAAALLGVAVSTAPPALAGPADKARALEKEGRHGAAAEAWAEALKGAPTDRGLALGLAGAAVRARHAALLPVAQDALYPHFKKDEKDLDVRRALGWVCLEIEQIKTQDNAKRLLNAEAEDHFDAVLALAPQDGEAAAGKARALYERGNFRGAIEVVDAWLAQNPPQPAHALYWKGQALYLMARDAHQAAGGGYPLPPEVRSLFERARGAYDASVAGDPARAEGWLQAAYAAQYLGDVAGAAAGYEKALVLMPGSDLPLRGLEALNAHDPPAWTRKLRELAAAHPEHPMVQYYLGWNRLLANDAPAAIAAFKVFAASDSNPAFGQQLLGQAYRAAGDNARALKAFAKALELDPAAHGAAEHWEELLRSGYQPDPVRAAAASVKAARQMIADYAPLFRAAPHTASVRNNLAFTLREAFGAHRNDAAWRPILDECVRLYEEASALVGEWDAAKAATWGWTARWDAAQVLNDTGLMFFFYPEIRDLEKAEEYYDRAVLFSDHGYRDTLGNLERLYGEQGRWEDLHAAALGYAEGARNRDGSPDMNTRAQAEGLARRLEREGKVTR